MPLETLPRPKPGPDESEPAWLDVIWTEVHGSAVADKLVNLSQTEALLLTGGVWALLVLVFFVIRSRRASVGGGDESCRWKKDHWWRPFSKFDRWICRECGVDAYTRDRRPPKECKRILRERAL